MGRIIAMLLAVVGIWIGVEVYNEGLQGAFDGAFAQLDDGSGEPVTPGTAPERAGKAVEAAHAAAADRRQKLLGE